MTFSEKLTRLRRQKGLSQEQLAELLDVSRQSVSKWEAQQTLPEPGKIIMLSELFGVSIDRLLKNDLPLEEESNTAEAVLPMPAAEQLHVVFCTRCGRENRADSAFCGYCGNPFAVYAGEGAGDGGYTKTDMELAYYRADLQMRRQALQMQKQELEEVKKQTARQRQQLEQMMKCPHCGSTSLSADKKGYGFGKGFLGAALFGPMGLFAGGIGSGKVTVTCMKCGYKFKR